MGWSFCILRMPLCLPASFPHSRESFPLLFMSVDASAEGTRRHQVFQHGQLFGIYFPE